MFVARCTIIACTRARAYSVLNVGGADDDSLLTFIVTHHLMTIKEEQIDTYTARGRQRSYKLFVAIVDNFQRELAARHTIQFQQRYTEELRKVNNLNVLREL